MAKLVSIEEVLGDNLYSKICEISTSVDVEKITGMLLECEKNQILQMLSDKEVLQHYVETASETLSDIEMNNNIETHDYDPAAVIANSVNVDQDDDILSVSSSKESFAEELYDRVLAILNCEILTSKITGMLLDVDFGELTEVIKSEDKLKEAIEKAKRVLSEDDLLKCTHERISDQIYSRVKIKYPDLAPQITGMLIEMSTESLTNLLRNEAEFDIKIQEAIRVLS